MKKLRRLDGTFLRVALVILLCLAANLLVAQVNVTTYSQRRAHWPNTPETTLIPAIVNSGQVGKLFTTTLDGGYVTRNRSI